MSSHPLPTACPVCQRAMDVVRLQCPACGTAVEGTFQATEFERLPPDKLEFLRLFLRARGNLKEVGRVLGVSYPTVRARFENLLAALGYQAAGGAEAEDVERQGILDALERGEITAREAAERLRGAGRGPGRA